MKTLSPKKEQEVIDALKAASDAVDGGIAPDVAVEKAARQHKWGPDMIRFASYAFNTGRQTAQREASKTALDKFATFPLANPENIISSIWPSRDTVIKEAGYCGVSRDYDATPRWLADEDVAGRLAALRGSSQPMTKSAAEVLSAPSIDRLLRQRDTLKRAADFARNEAGVAYEQLHQHLLQLAGYFRKSAFDRLQFAQVEAGANIKFAGVTGGLMDWVYSTARCREARWTDTTKFAYLLDVDMRVSPWSDLACCVAAGRVVVEKRAAHAAAADALADHEKKLRKAAGLGELAIGAAGGSGMVNKAIGSVMDDSSVQHNLEALEDPAHDSKLREIQTQAMLSEMLQDDPIISGYPPAQVLKAYNEISQIAPRVAGQTMAVRSLLRRHLQGNLEPHEAQQLTDLEKSTKDVSTPVGPLVAPASAPKNENTNGILGKNKSSILG